MGVRLFWKEFKEKIGEDSEIAIECQTKEEAEEFLNYLLSKKLCDSKTKENILNYYDMHKKEKIYITPKLECIGKDIGMWLSVCDYVRIENLIVEEIKTKEERTNFFWDKIFREREKRRHSGIAIYCDTMEKSKKLLNYLHKKGFAWEKGVTLVEEHPCFNSKVFNNCYYFYNPY